MKARNRETLECLIWTWFGVVGTALFGWEDILVAESVGVGQGSCRSRVHLQRLYIMSEYNLVVLRVDWIGAGCETL